MLESPWQPAHNGEPHALPQLDSAIVRGNDEIELHVPEFAPARFIQRVRAHGPSHAPAVCSRCNDIAAVCHMSTAAPLVRSQVIGPDNCTLIVGYEHRMSW